MEKIQFSLGRAAVQFNVNGQSFKVAKGLNDIESESIQYKKLDALALENLIYRVEEILEQLKLDYKIQRVADTSDEFMQQLLEQFFNNETLIDRIKLEHAFNEFVEHTEYYVQQHSSEHFYLFVYFIFIREMMHHWNVVEIRVGKNQTPQ